VEEGHGRPSLWTNFQQQIYLGSDAFIERLQNRLPEEKDSQRFRKPSAASSAACRGISTSTATRRWQWPRPMNPAPTRSHRLRDISECITVR
jgi:hypothetical protein